MDPYNRYIEREICKKTQDEGIGSVYERIMLKRFFEKITHAYKFNSVLEYGCEITKGFDNLVFMKSSGVTIADKNIDNIKKCWKFGDYPTFSNNNITEKYDLVWNFATVQINPEIIKEMKILSKQYILFFVPNILNWGTPFHWAYHFFTRTECKHAERGIKSLRTKIGLKRFARKNGIKILDCRYIDIPPIPDIGFSINELKEFLGKEVKKGANIQNPEEIAQKIEKMTFIEKRDLPTLLKAFFAHHIYLLGERRD